MPTAEATVETQHPGRYLTRLCEHAGQMDRSRLHRPRRHADGGAPPEIRHVEWTATDAVVTLNWGRWTIHATPGRLTLRAEAGTGEDLRRIQDLVAARMEKIGRRDHLVVNWQPAETPGGPARPLPADPPIRAGQPLHVVVSSWPLSSARASVIMSVMIWAAGCTS